LSSHPPPTNAETSARRTGGMGALSLACVGDPPASMAVRLTAFPVTWSSRTPHPDQSGVFGWQGKPLAKHLL
jgi:hypothetical protein